MTASATVGRPKIEGLVSINLRIPTADLDALDRIVSRERVERYDPGLTRTDLLREIVARYVRSTPAE